MLYLVHSFVTPIAPACVCLDKALYPGGKERMRRLMKVIESNRLDLGVLVIHHYNVDDIANAYDLFSNQRDGVLNMAIKPK